MSDLSAADLTPGTVLRKPGAEIVITDLEPGSIGEVFTVEDAKVCHCGERRARDPFHPGRSATRKGLEQAGYEVAPAVNASG